MTARVMNHRNMETRNVVGQSRGMDKDTTKAIIPTPIWVWNCAKNPWSPWEMPLSQGTTQCHNLPTVLFPDTSHL